MGVKRRGFDVGLVVINLVAILISPLLLLNWLRRTVLRSKPAPLVWERLSGKPYTSLKADQAQTHLVIAGASYGEALLIDRLSRALESSLGRVQITWAIRDPKAVEQLIAAFPDQAIVSWPYENLFSATRWNSNVRPDILVFVERFRFPNFVVASARNGVDVVLANGRFRKSASGYLRWLFRSYSVLLFQADSYLESATPHLSAATKALVSGDLKFDLTAKEVSAESGAGIDLWLGSENAPILAAGSTDSLKEEQLVLEAFEVVKRTTKCKLLIAPRKLERVPELLAEIRSRGFSLSQRTDPEPEAEVFVLDTMGELAYAYKHCKVAYVGGALFGMGHNVIEPIEWGVPVAYGRNRGHFELMQRACEEAGVGARIATANELKDFWLESLNDGIDLEQRCRQLVEENRGALERTSEAIAALIREREAL